MTEVVVYAFYVWVIVSLGVLGLRLARHLWVMRRSRTPSTATSESTAAEPPTIDLRSEPAPATVDPPAPNPDPTPTPTPTIDLSPPSTPRSNPSATPASPPTPERYESSSALAAHPPGRLTVPVLNPDPAPPAQVTTLAEVLRGVRLPYGLAPTPDTVEANSDQSVALATDRATPAEVGTAVADELERLGFVVAAHADDEATATSVRAAVGLRIVPIDAETERHPDVAPGSVVLRLWIVEPA